MIHIWICDDDEEFLENFVILLQKAMEQLNQEFRIRKYTDAKQLKFELEDTNRPADIFFLDVLIGEENGIHLAQEIRKRKGEAPIVFLSMNKEYVFDAFDVMPLKYFLKERVTLEEVKKLLEKAVKLIGENEKEMFIYKKGHCLRQIPLKEIHYFEVMNRIVTIHGENICEEFYSTIDQVEKTIENSQFLRIHRSYLINMNQVNRIEGKEILLFDGTEIPIGGKYAESIQKYFKFLLSRI